MDLLFAGLVALGVAVTVVVLLKSLCFLSECLRERCHQRMGSRLLLDYYHPGAPQSSNMQGLSTNTQLGPGGSSMNAPQNFAERLYVICVDTDAPKFARNPKPFGCDEQDIDSPPTYEEAMYLINSSISPASNSSHSS